jgi:hypothetical protein
LISQEEFSTRGSLTVAIGLNNPLLVVVIEREERARPYDGEPFIGGPATDV